MQRLSGRKIRYLVCGLKEGKMEYMTIKELAETYGLHRNTITNIVRELYPNEMRKGVKTLLTRDMVAEIIEYIHPTAGIASKVKPKILEGGLGKFDEVGKLDNLMQTVIGTQKQVVDTQKRVIDTQKQMVDIQKQMIDTQKQISERLDRLGNKTNDTKSHTYTPTHDEYEYYYISTIARKFGVKSKDVLYALFQMNEVKRSQYTGRYEPTEQALDAGDLITKLYLKDAIMINRKLLPELKNIFDNWKRNSTKLF